MGLFDGLFGRRKQKEPAPQPKVEVELPPEIWNSDLSDFSDADDLADASDIDALDESFDFSTSIDFSLSKDDLFEGMSMTAASLEDAAQRGRDAITTERIRRGDTILETYEVETDAIPGGMGSVWRVRHAHWDKELAMKRPHPRFFAEAGAARKAAFVDECEHWINLGLHPNIVSCYYVRELGEVPTIFSEWMDAGSLKDAITSGALWEGSDDEVQRRILDIAIQAARGLAYSHERGLLHLDVKPGNILLNSAGDAKVADFGLATSTAKLAAGATAAGASVLGYTPAYCSPEQAEGGYPEPCMDAYSWALTVFEMYAGGRTWTSGTEVEQLLAQGDGQLRVALPAPVRALLERCVFERQHDLATVADELEACYQLIVGEPYPRSDAASAADQADTLNNRALSMLDLGMEEEAEHLWQQALAINPTHLPTVYNHALDQWHAGIIDDVEAMRLVRATRSPRAEELVERIRQEAGFADEQYQKLAVDDPRRLLPGVEGEHGTFTRYLSGGDRMIRTDRNTWIRLLDAQSEACLAEYDLGLHPENGALAPLAIDKAERFVASAGAEGTVYLWDLESGLLVHALEGHTGWVRAVALGDDGSILLSGGRDRTVKYWSTQTGRCIGSFKLDAEVRALAIDSHDAWALAGTSDGGIILLALPDGDECGRLRGHDAGVEYLQFVEQDDELRALSCAGNEVRYWDVLIEQCLLTLEGRRCAWDGEGEVVVNTYDGCYCWSLKEEVEAAWELSVIRQTTEVLDVQQAFEQELASAQECLKKSDYTAAVEHIEAARSCEGYENDPRIDELTAQLDATCAKVGIHAITQTGKVSVGHDYFGGMQVNAQGVAFVRFDDGLIVRNLNDESIQHLYRNKDLFGEDLRVNDLQLARDGKCLLVASYGARYALLEFTADGSQLVSHELGLRLAGQHSGGALCADATLSTVAYAGIEKTYVEDLAAHQVLESFDLVAEALALSADGRSLYYIEEDGSELVKQPLAGQGSPMRFEIEADAFSELSFDGDEATMLAAGAEGQVEVLDTHTGKSIATLQGVEADDGRYLLSNDGRFAFVSSYADERLRVFDARTGEQVFELGGTGGIEIFCLSDDMHGLYTLNTDGELRSWQISYRYEATG